MHPRAVTGGRLAGLGARLCRRLAGRAGTAAVEFALVLPMLMVLVLGTVEVGFAILSHASMTATLARVPDLALQSPDVATLQARLEALSETRLGLGLSRVDFDDATEACLCPGTAADTLADWMDVETASALAKVAPCPADCAGEADGVRLYIVTGGVSMPSLIPGDSAFDLRPPKARLMVPAPLGLEP